ncbi:hypothetical protein A2379_03800 [Candidatus Amesbacteria bacterium RIFOXYB1_FULL_47_13]|nr:MAG: hypothetical protein A2379_03800 [Candidatus Amesbacteria bacterium RIFOXYB1_FULL_47_13]HBC72433.1 TlyA family rRNA (cytidine-2'-O)-methyltransferase [Candidatus Amesbacteria bacterium]
MEGKYVSRAGVKLEGAMREFGVNAAGKVCLDAGAATGGFTDCLLQHGAKKVYAVETGYGVLAWKLRNDPKVVVRERTNILYEEDIAKEIEMAVVDVSWTRLKLAIPAVSRFMMAGGVILALIKPQYEVDKKELHGGVLVSDKAWETAQKTKEELVNSGFKVSDTTESVIKGEGGNREYWVRIDL